MSEIEALILGLVQGLTEYLPVSSSGHLTIGSALFGIDGEQNLTFTILVHVATVLSTLVILWKEISWIFKGLFKFEYNEETKYTLNILVSMIPIGIVGVFFKDKVEEIFGSGLLIVGCMLLVTAALLAFSYFAKPRQKEKLSIADAFIIGLAQAVAVLPGLSRSGSTIATGLLLGNKKRKAGAVLLPHGHSSDTRRSLTRRGKSHERRSLGSRGRHIPDFACHRFRGCVRGRMPGLQVDDKYREERQTDIFRHLLRHCRSHNRLQ